jgi:hypothetical protein
MKTEPCELISATINADLWEKIQFVANHYSITPTDHCRLCFGYYAALWRKETRKNPAQRSKPPAQATEPGGNVIPFHTYRASRRASIPAVS